MPEGGSTVMKAKGYSTIAGLEKLTPEEIKARNLETYGNQIRKFRKKAGLSAEELADILQISKSSIRNWECGLTRPDPEFLYRMFSILDVEPNEFFGIGGIGTILTDRERTLIRQYRTLDDHGKEDLETIADAMSNKAYMRKLRAARVRMNTAIDRNRYVAAGTGEDWNENPYSETVVLYDNPDVSKADEIFTVNGASMEPQYYDGDKVLVEYCSDLKNGDIGIFYVPGFGGVIKQKAYDRLHSLNPDYDDIFPYEQGAKLIGRVVGKITKDMIPSAEDVSLYAEAMATLKE